MKKKSQIIRFEQNLCNAKVDDNEILFVRVDSIVRDADARLEIPPTHNAIVIKGGGDIRYYKSGTYDIFDDKKEIKNWKSGLSVEVIYIPKDTRLKMKWGTAERLMYRDEASNKVIPVGAKGDLEVSVANPELFYREIVGAKKEFNVMEFKSRYMATITGKFTNIFLKTIKDKRATYDQFDEYKELIGNQMSLELEPIFAQDGLTVKAFGVLKITVDEEDMQKIEASAAERQKQEKLKEYLAELERLDDKQWEREKYLRQLELQDKAAYYEVLKVMGSHPKPAEKEEFKCPHCGFEYKATDKFCPRCGKRVSKDPIICASCGKSNDSSAVFCANCGKKLV